MTLEQFIYIIGAAMVSIIGFFIVRSINKNDKVIDDHEERLNGHEELIQKLIGQMDTMQKVSNIQYENLNKKLDHIVIKLDAYDSSIKEFYEKYELPLKK